MAFGSGTLGGNWDRVIEGGFHDGTDGFKRRGRETCTDVNFLRLTP